MSATPIVALLSAAWLSLFSGHGTVASPAPWLVDPTTPAFGSALQPDQWSISYEATPFHVQRKRALEAKATSGSIYLTGADGTFVYALNGSRKKARTAECTLSQLGSVSGLSADEMGNIIIAGGEQTSGEVEVFAQSASCGEEVGQFQNPFGTGIDVASENAVDGPIYVANVRSFHGSQREGSISICSLASGCTKELRTPVIHGLVGGVAIDADGDVYVSGYAHSGRHDIQGALAFLKGGIGPGVPASGFVNRTPGGLEFDSAGNLLAIDWEAGNLWVYSGCPACVAHGPSPLHGPPLSTRFGRLTPDGAHFEAADETSGTVDVFAYQGTSGITYQYSFQAIGAIPAGIAITASP